MPKLHVISDVHGEPTKLLDALTVSRIVDKNGKRVESSDVVVQLGDLANCVYSSQDGDRECLQLVENGVIDFMLVGNHEFPYFNGNCRFSGFWNYVDIGSTLWELNDAGKLRAAMSYNNILFTHAGLSASLLGFRAQNADEISDWLNGNWHEGNYADSVFTNIGLARYGDSNMPGILWCDWDEHVPMKNLKQIFGHTPDRTIRSNGLSTCIDTGGGKFGQPTILTLELE
jgi:hypothetical protein